MALIPAASGLGATGYASNAGKCALEDRV